MRTNRIIYKRGGGLLSVVLLSLGLSLMSSCEEWLDVRGENIQKEQDQFEDYKGFRDVLTGCYMSLGSTDIYGQRLTMTDIESLADLWYNTSSYENNYPDKYYLSIHDYSKDEPRVAIKAIYGGLFNTIATANVILKNIEEKGNNITNSKARNVIEGEALAIRAYCQLDVLRMFGQLPNGGTKTVNLPYSYTTSIDEMPAWYGYNKYVELLTADITKAEELLKGSDP
ncbi:MAG: RagB/SusD family nutrient uptake outer membrane protein, partial [Aeriscardovia sp.]|nr:RagB/SusD family nutrient uptake outer membrane protein [Aeriscardovia sp.]